MHSICTGDAATRFGFTNVEDSISSPASAASSISDGTTAELALSASFSSYVDMMTTNSLVALTLRAVSVPARAEITTIGGSKDRLVNWLNGARLGTPSMLSDDTHAIGRGTQIDLNGLKRSP